MNTLPDESEMVFATVKATADGEGSLKGSGPALFLGPFETHQICTWSYKRDDTADPGVPGCPP